MFNTVLEFIIFLLYEINILKRIEITLSISNLYMYLLYYFSWNYKLYLKKNVLLYFLQYYIVNIYFFYLTFAKIKS